MFCITLYFFELINFILLRIKKQDTIFSILLENYSNTIAFIFLLRAVPVATFVAVVNITRT